MEFAYNNSFQASIRIALYEVLCRRKCRSLLCWDDVGECRILGPQLVQKTCEKIKLIQDRLKGAQDRQKNYVDKRRRELEFLGGDKVFLKIALMKRKMRR